MSLPAARTALSRPQGEACVAEPRGFPSPVLDSSLRGTPPKAPRIQSQMASDHLLPTSPLSLAYPHCGADPGKECERTSLFTTVHIARTKAAIRADVPLSEESRPKGEAA